MLGHHRIFMCWFMCWIFCFGCACFAFYSIYNESAEWLLGNVFSILSTHKTKEQSVWSAFIRNGQSKHEQTCESDCLSVGGWRGWWQTTACIQHENEQTNLWKTREQIKKNQSNEKTIFCRHAATLYSGSVGGKMKYFLERKKRGKRAEILSRRLQYSHLNAIQTPLFSIENCILCE